jgi:hypothetical protein
MKPNHEDFTHARKAKERNLIFGWLGSREEMESLFQIRMLSV